MSFLYALRVDKTCAAGHAWERGQAGQNRKEEKAMLTKVHGVIIHQISKGGTLALHEHDPKDQKHHLSS